MTDEEVLDEYEAIWYDAGLEWSEYIKSIPINKLIQIARVDQLGGSDNFDELKRRTIPDEFKLEVMILITEYYDNYDVDYLYDR